MRAIRTAKPLELMKANSLAQCRSSRPAAKMALRACRLFAVTHAVLFRVSTRMAKAWSPSVMGELVFFRFGFRSDWAWGRWVYTRIKVTGGLCWAVSIFGFLLLWLSSIRLTQYGVVSVKYGRQRWDGVQNWAGGGGGT